MTIPNVLLEYPLGVSIWLLPHCALVSRFSRSVRRTNPDNLHGTVSVASNSVRYAAHQQTAHALQFV
jgi:hypothetical protein